MAFTFSIIEWASVIDPHALFRKTGQSEGEIGSGGKTGVDTVSFASRATAQVTTAMPNGADDYPDDGGARLDAAVTLNGTSFAAGANVEADFEMIFLEPSSGLHFRATWLAIGNVPVGVSISRGWDAEAGRYVEGPAGLCPTGSVLTLIDGDTLIGTPNLGQFKTSASFLTSGAGTNARLNRNGAVICFAAGTAIATSTGEVAVETLRVGDLVVTRDRGLQPVRWIARRRVGSGLLAAMPQLRPIHIAEAALGAGLPRRDLLVSPQHRLLVRSEIARRMFGTDEVLVAARHLCGLPGILARPGTAPVDYWHFACDRHEVVFAHGAPAEALYPGPQALRAVEPTARAELLALFPQLAEPGQPSVPPARPLVPGRQGRNLARRHARNKVALLPAQ
ncbi:Hint domain-containing protein [Paracoccus salsus]|uniref:Hint domain-containing protein n=1 Tax=Paracoccus salsus TaxID=2911061 RepID=UPI001F46CA3B|nr:Hint domain-containing protein [Paracoccus salsus]MCF3973044.1 Hint domain-containing protein [Paracoccus salsus]